METKKTNAGSPAIKTSTAVAAIILMSCVCVSLIGAGLALLFSTCESLWLAFISKPAGMACLALAWLLWPAGSRDPREYDKGEDYWN